MARNYKRDRLGRFARVNTLRRLTAGGKVSGSERPSRRVAVVPHARISPRSSTVGVNSGANLTKGTRVSAGFYLRVERRHQTGVEKILKKADAATTTKIAKRISPHSAATPLIENQIRKARRKTVNRLLGGQKKVGENAYARLTTSQTGLPSIAVRRGMAKVSSQNRRAAIDDYNKAMAVVHGKKVKKARPQRRGGRG